MYWNQVVHKLLKPRAIISSTESLSLEGNMHKGEHFTTMWQGLIHVFERRYSTGLIFWPNLTLIQLRWRHYQKIFDKRSQVRFNGGYYTSYKYHNP